MEVQNAIIVRNAKKRYSPKAQILTGLNMTVPRGCIYGLLGASGCGKSTLLSCVVGVKQLDSGDIWVLGGKPGTKGSGIPGPRIGYMPQDISLVDEFTVMAALKYFGTINGLSKKEIEQQYVALEKLFLLPPRDRLIRNLSGGQARRVSFAVALLHKPELLILDEPTVGVDPVLRENIWKHLVQITREYDTTVVITTHYIEEAKDSNKIGLMRGGQLLAETSPTKLLQHFRCDTLEEAFLIMCQQQQNSTDNSQQSMPAIDAEEASDDFSLAAKIYPKKSVNKLKNSFGRKFKALMFKNSIQFIRHPGLILYTLLFPLIQTCAFYMTIGHDLNAVNIAVVNLEAGNCNSGNYNGSVIYHSPDDCDFVNLSCRFLREYNDSVAKKVYYDTLNEAHEAIRNGRAAATIFFDKNFSLALQRREKDLRAASDEDILNGQIQVWLDMADRQIGLYLEKELFSRFFDIFGDILEECHLPRSLGNIPLRFEDPIYGTKNQSYTEFVAPGFLLTLVFFLATSVSSSVIISDRHEGVWDRSLVQGVTTNEILLSHLLSQLSLIVIQVTITMSISFLGYQLQCNGSTVAAIILVFLTGCCGMCYGFLISVMIRSQTTANYASTGSFYPVILLCGCIWPLEGMPKVLKWISLCSPVTVPTLSMRGILTKGLPFGNSEVYIGFLVILTWIIGLLVICFITLRSKNT